MGNRSVVIFCEGEYARTVTQIETMDRAAGVRDGVVIGANLRRPGAVAAYVIPEETAKMHAEQRPEEVSKAR